MNWIVDKGPHIKDKDNTSAIMIRFLIPLVVIFCFGIFKNTIVVYYKENASIIEILNPVLMVIVAILTSLISEYLYFKIVLKRKSGLKDLYNSYALIPGLLLALTLPINTPLWIVAIGAFSANIIGKMIFGGLGENIFNPALIGYLLITVSYSSLFGSYLNLYELDSIAGSTPLTNFANLNYYGTYESLVGSYGNIFNFFVGNIPGSLGEVSKLLIIISFIYLALTKTIKWKISVMYIGTVFVMTYIVGLTLGYGIWFPLFQILSGSVMFGAVFMATDPVTSPITNIGQIFYGISLGILTVVIRFLTPYPEGVMTSILFMNMLVALFDKIGLKIKNNTKKCIIPLIIIIAIITISLFIICNAVLKSKTETDNNLVKGVEIVDKQISGNTTTYKVTSKAWGVIEATVEVRDKKITSIIVTNSNTETQWSEIEKSDYVNKVISNQKNIDNLDAVTGSTKSSNALKNIVKKIMEDIDEK